MVDDEIDDEELENALVVEPKLLAIDSDDDEQVEAEVMLEPSVELDEHSFEVSRIGDDEFELQVARNG